MSGGTGITETLVCPQFGGAASTAMPTSPPLPRSPVPPVPTTTAPPVPTWPPVALLPPWPPLPTTSIPPDPLVVDWPVPALNPQPVKPPGTRRAQATRKPTTCRRPSRIDGPPTPVAAAELSAGSARDVWQVTLRVDTYA